GGLARLAPLTAVLFLVPALNLSGIPPLSGFLGKVGLLQAGLAAGSQLALVFVVAGTTTSLLTLYVIVKAWNKAFWQPPLGELPRVRMPRGMVGPTAALLAVGLFLTVLAGPLYALTDRAAVDLLGQGRYVRAVLPDGQRGVGESVEVVNTP